MLQVIHMALECARMGLESTIVFRVLMVLIRDIHRVSGCYHFYPQAVDNYDAGCIAQYWRVDKLLASKPCWRWGVIGDV